MKKILTLLTILAFSSGAFAQDTLGLVAHWDFNGSANDVTGKGHDGTLHNVIPAIGKNGLPNTAYYFTGDVTKLSYISAPDSPDLNMNTYSICATFMVKGFYSGTCQANDIFQRGQQYNDGNYAMVFTDNDYDSGDCSKFDSTHDAFELYAGKNIPSNGSWIDSPFVTENKWYSVVGTFDSVNFKIYVNGQLVNTVLAPAPPSAIGTTTDGITIGLNGLGDTINYPYSFKGIIDDIRLYNRVLSDNEIQQYDTSTTLSASNLVETTQSLNIYPNPATNIVNIRTQSPVNANVKVFNELGQIMNETKLTNGATQFSVNNFSPGFYFVKVQAGDQIIATKFIKQQ